jgi:hypothetical protein
MTLDPVLALSGSYSSGRWSEEGYSSFGPTHDNHEILGKMLRIPFKELTFAVFMDAVNERLCRLDSHPGFPLLRGTRNEPLSSLLAKRCGKSIAHREKWHVVIEIRLPPGKSNSTKL